jgi:hypothetical protein
MYYYESNTIITIICHLKQLKNWYLTCLIIEAAGINLNGHDSLPPEAQKNIFLPYRVFCTRKDVRFFSFFKIFFYSMPKMIVEMKQQNLEFHVLYRILSSLCFCVAFGDVDTMQGCTARRYRCIQSIDWLCFSGRNWASDSWLFSKN